LAEHRDKTPAHLILRQSIVLWMRQAWSVQAACGALKTWFISCTCSITTTSQVNIAVSDIMAVRLSVGVGGCSEAALCLVGRGVAATHRGRALLGVVAGSAYRVDDRGWEEA